METDKFLKIIWTWKGSRRAKNLGLSTLVSKVTVLALLNMKTYYKAIFIKTMWYRREGPQTDPGMQGTLFHEGNIITEQSVKKRLSNKLCWDKRISPQKWNLTPTLCYTPKQLCVKTQMNFTSINLSKRIQAVRFHLYEVKN